MNSRIMHVPTTHIFIFVITTTFTALYSSVKSSGVSNVYFVIK